MNPETPMDLSKIGAQPHDALFKALLSITNVPEDLLMERLP